MAHLGARVAAYVDGQLSDDEHDDAANHLAQCSDCHAAVRQQRVLKNRMTGLDAVPDPPESLRTTLTDVERVRAAARQCHTARSRMRRLLRCSAIRTLVAFTGASVTVTAIAYSAGAGTQTVHDPVTPPIDRFVAQFVPAGDTPPDRTSRSERRVAPPAIRQRSGEPGAVRPVGDVAEPIAVFRRDLATARSVAPANASSMSTVTMSALTRSGWPCHSGLAGNLTRISGQWLNDEHEQMVSLGYSDGHSRLSLFEQRGELDTVPLTGFAPQMIDRATIWIRHGTPTVATWDHAGVVYTVVTDAGDGRLADVVEDLPHAPLKGGTLHRIGTGLERITTWADPVERTG